MARAPRESGPSSSHRLAPVDSASKLFGGSAMLEPAGMVLVAIPALRDTRFGYSRAREAVVRNRQLPTSTLRTALETQYATT